jgi:NAD(P)-dependent dehydrogenase (short-subunit alcohol dehydrogenase family)
MDGSTLTAPVETRSNRLLGRKVLVTGSSKGIGRGIAIRLAEEGADVVINYNSDPRGAEEALAEVEALGRRGAIIKANLGTVAEVRDLVARSAEALGGLDVLVNNAGIGIGAPVQEIVTKRLDMQLDVNLRAMVIFYRECHDLLVAAGKETHNALVVNLASVAGKSGQGWLSVYAATKFGVVGFTESMNQELGRLGIKSCALCPGFVDTKMTDFVKESVAAEEMIRPTDIAEMVRALLRLSPSCVIPEIIFLRPGEGI